MSSFSFDDGDDDVPDANLSITEILKDATNLAKRAVEHDSSGNSQIAKYFYQQAVDLMDRAKNYYDHHGNQPGLETTMTNVEHKILEYQNRINCLEKLILENDDKEAKDTNRRRKSSEQMELERAKCLVHQAQDEDVKGDIDTALSLYMEAVELCIKCNKKDDPKLSSQITALAKQALERAEVIKGNRTGVVDSPPSRSSPTNNVPAAASAPTPTLSSGTSHVVSGATALTPEEKQVLLYTSEINRIQYVPFMTVDLNERFAYPLPFSDKNGLLNLSPKQKKQFVRWARPDEIWKEPKMIANAIDYLAIKQTIVSDCSFVASLAISALYEKRFKKRLITPIIYPQNRAGEPVYNPCGKYMVKLNINGVLRKVIIDDFLPVGDHGQVLCSYSNNKGELWVSLMEKAYMKVMGGYDFPGSNSNIDLHALTGWIPERVSLNTSDKVVPFDKEATFRKLHDRLHKGHVLVTVATGDMPDSVADRAGLVPTHAYAVLDIQVVNGQRLFLLKNPWSHLRWRGNYSELDTVHWTPELKKYLNYDPNSAATFDNGVFWIDYDSICKFFDVFYMNWDPVILFSHTYCIHKTWNAGQGPIKDVYTVGDNPQYRLEVRATSSAAVWVLLTRHITDIQDFKHNSEYITIVVYDSDGKKVYYPENPFIDGVRINSPHYLCKIVVSSPGTKCYTLVVSQYEKMKSIHYTLKAFGSCPFSLHEIPQRCKHTKHITGEWKGRSAGGCANHPETHRFNPTYQISLKSSGNDNVLIVQLKAPKQFQVGFDVLSSSSNADSKSHSPGFTKKSSGPYRPGFVIMEIENVHGGHNYNIIPSTFYPGMEAPFFLDIHSSCDFTLKQLPHGD